MLNDFVELLKNFHLNREFIVLIVSMMPIFELRGAIPLAVLHFKMPVLTAFMISWIGNLLPVLPIIYFLEPIRKVLSNIKCINRFFTWLYARTYKRSKKVMRLGAIGLSLFVAIPLPVTGAWTGSVVAILFDIKPQYAFPAIILGVTIAGIVVSSFVSLF
ncbi:MAG: small multi-drug export protein [Candidatus Aminicenantes bacterium]|nr:small multi-drug export protein [Candidatus Aminicenantes bacterium]MDH5384925.1 small multi-drug export protein [Candidatus Aminicenantes bacterium]MDH5743201.1 small multi-drug export protein [Candidatus Aminicenantes bacterium]